MLVPGPQVESAKNSELEVDPKTMDEHQLLEPYGCTPLHERHSRYREAAFFLNLEFGWFHILRKMDVDVWERTDVAAKKRRPARISIPCR